MSDSLRAILTDPAARRWYMDRIKRMVGYSTEDLVRVVANADCREFLLGLQVAELDCLEISPGTRTHWKKIGFRSYTPVDYPAFDITKDRLDRTFDVVIAEQVWEHLRHPYAAARNVRSMLKDDGLFVLSTPFMIRVHGAPHDYTRWTERGLAAFLEDCGFVATVKSWGNRRAVAANLNRWAEFGWFRNLRHEPDFPVNVWAFARPATSPPETQPFIP